MMKIKKITKPGFAGLFLYNGKISIYPFSPFDSRAIIKLIM